ncbi:MAG: T9SS type A sorting domain-containing protein [Bacteroidota bacterium]
MVRAFLTILIALSGSSAAQELDWEPAGGPMSRAIFLDDVGEGVVIAWSGGSLWRSTDGGSSWSSAYAENLIAGPRQFVRSESGAILAYGHGNYMYRSGDNGVTWQTFKPTGTSTSQFADIIALPDRLLSLRIDGALHASYNDGRTWSHVATLDIEYGLLASGPREVLWAAGRNGTFRSYDFGLTWEALPVTSASGLNRTVEAISATATATYAIAGSRLYVLTEGPNEAPRWENLAYANGRGLSVADAGRTVLIGNRWGSIARSLDGGNTWEEIQFGNDSIDTILRLEAGTYLANVRDQGVWRSDDYGATWNRTGVPSCDVTNIYSVNDGAVTRLWTGCRDGGGYFESRDSGVLWKHQASHPATITQAIATTNEGTLFLISGPGLTGVFRSIDDGLSWEKLFEGRNATFVPGPGPVFYVVFPDRLYRTTDEGETWDERRLPGHHYAVTTMPSGRLIVTVGGPNVYYSDDGGISWEPARKPPPVGNLEVLAVDQDGTLYAPSYFYGIYRSTDGGETWGKTGYEGQFRYGDGPFAAGEGGVAVLAEENRVYYTLDGGETWLGGGDVFPHEYGPYVKLTSLFVSPLGRVVAGTSGMGVYTAWLPNNGALDEPPPAKESPYLYVSPNPAHDRAVATIATNDERTVNVTVLNAIGQIVMTIHEGLLAPGDHSFEIDCSEFLSGIYLVRVDGDGLSLSRSLTIVQ